MMLSVTEGVILYDNNPKLCKVRTEPQEGKATDYSIQQSEVLRNTKYLTVKFDVIFYDCTSCMCLELLELWAQSQRDLQWLQHSALLRRVLSTQGLGDPPRRLLHTLRQATGQCALAFSLRISDYCTSVDSSKEERNCHHFN